MKNALFLSALIGLLAACADAPPPETESEAPPADAAVPAPPPSPGSVTIVEPVVGDTVDGPDILVRLEAQGVRIVPAGDTTPGTGHHHVFLDADVSEPGVPIPAVEGSVIHMGDGSSELTLTGVEPGEHRLITVVADGLHVPLQPWVVDTVNIVVRQ